MSSASDAPVHKLDIRTLYASQKRREDSKRELYETVVAKVHHRIQTVAARSETVCTFQIPPYIIGMPLYDAFQCCGYVIKRLKSEGFVVQYGHPNVLLINWDRPSIESHVNAMNTAERTHSGGGGARVSGDATGGSRNGGVGGAGNDRGQAPSMQYNPTGQLFS